MHIFKGIITPLTLRFGEMTLHPKPQVWVITHYVRYAYHIVHSSFNYTSQMPNHLVIFAQVYSFFLCISTSIYKN